ncbi:MAG TPA: PspC domain-containing protein, partial [Actinomycetes bacterium]|nr:PspC domain-containing protein [Actinomycetes bacterium]
MPDETIGPEGPADRAQPSAGADRVQPAPGDHDPPGGHPPPPGYPAQLPRRITRRMDDRMIAGVASGLGAYFNVDPVVFRIGFVALTLAGGVGVLIYLLCWLLFPPVFGPQGDQPRQPQTMLPAAVRQGGWKTYLAMGAVLLAVMLLFGSFTRPTVVFALLLIAVGALLLVQD